MTAAHDGADTPTSRHIGAEVLASNHDSGIPGVFTVTGLPAARIGIHPGERRVTLSVRTTGDPTGPDLSNLSHLDCSVDHHDSQVWQRLDVTYTADNLPEVYAVLCVILDRVQLEGQDFTAAVQAVLAGLDGILTGTGALSREHQVGLFGELTTLLAAGRALGVSSALAAWRGPQREEHDFGLPDLDLEVKTTSTENRVHWIHGATQLLPTPGRALVLLSLQITDAGVGPGNTLTDLVQAARTAAANAPGAARASLEAGLQKAGWHDRHADIYRDRWALRSDPTCHPVDNGFPALTPAGLTAATSAAHRIVDLSYRIDVADLPTVPAPFPLTPTTGVLP
jgi:hypothetical protein